MQMLTHGYQPHQGVLCQSLIQSKEKISSIIFIILPGIFAIQYYAYKTAFRVCKRTVYFNKPVHKIICRFFCIPCRIYKSYEVRKYMVSEYYSNLFPICCYEIWLVQYFRIKTMAVAVPPYTLFLRLHQYLFISCNPVYTLIFYNKHNGFAYRTLGRPHPFWPLAKCLLMQLYASFNLLHSIFRADKSFLRKLYVWHCHFG